MSDNNQLWRKLWAFNNYDSPIFWFGDRVIYSEQTGIVLGMEYRTEDMEKLLPGWWYSVRLESKMSPDRIYETFLKRIETKALRQ